MQDPATFQATKPAVNTQLYPEQEQLKCPRCDSTNTKFCYYNNYNLSQPRHFCKNCRRYWTRGGALRNIPVGGGTRKNTKRSSSSNTKRSNSEIKPVSSTATITNATTAVIVTSTQQKVADGNLGAGENQNPTRLFGLDGESERKMMDVGGGESFSSLLASSGGQFGSFFDGLNANGSGLDLQGSGNSNNGGGESGDGGETGSGFLQSGGDWGSSNGGWPDLAIYTPGSSFQ